MTHNIADIASVFSIFAVFLALVALVVEQRRERLTSQTDLLLRLDEKLHSQEGKALRQVAARKLLDKEVQNYELEDLFEQLSTIAFLYERKAIDSDLTYKHFAYWMDRYWLCAKSYVTETRRRYDPYNYSTIQRVAEEFIIKEIKGGYPEFSEEVLENFLKEEARL